MKILTYRRIERVLSRKIYLVVLLIEQGSKLHDLTRQQSTLPGLGEELRELNTRVLGFLGKALAQHLRIWGIVVGGTIHTPLCWHLGVSTNEGLLSRTRKDRVFLQALQLVRS